ncbi:substrate-binding domain-containing protein [Hyphomonas sp.]|uniref:substrate-binding domain-containing protein n=1 Tax=Hyphomonas sp. TaxID=87 RepID=UPI001BCB798C|nr:substrate-binding domain-containing protein [Hyphomonas sp.]
MSVRLSCFLGAGVLILAACGQSDLKQLDTGEPGIKPVPAIARNQKVKIVGSSTVAPFSRTVAERFGAVSGFPTPIVETTGTGGGFKAFCEGVGPVSPSIINASRPMKASERELCARAGVTDITEVALGYDGIVVANSKAGADFDVTKEQLYLALAKEIPDGKGGFMPNPHKNWQDVSPDLPSGPIVVLGPPPTSGTRDAFVELGMEKGAEAIPQLRDLKAADEAAFKERAHTVRTDGVWVDFGENDSAIVQSLVKSPEAIGVLGFSFLEQNGDRVKGARLAGVEANFDNIVAGEYGLARIMFFYVKDQNLPLVEGLAEFVSASVDEGAAGHDGYLIEKGLIPLDQEDLKKQQALAEQLELKVRAY